MNNKELKEEYIKYLEELGITEKDYDFSEYKRDVWDEVNYDFYMGDEDYD